MNGRRLPGTPPPELFGLPVIVASDQMPAQLVEILTAAAEVAGKGCVVAGAGPSFDMIEQVASSADVITVICPSGEMAALISDVAASKGRPVPVLEFDPPGMESPVALRLAPRSLDLLESGSLEEINVPVPALDEPYRADLWDQLRDAGVHMRHHLVEVNGASVLTRGTPSLPELAAASSGVLAGRMAVTRAKWRAQASDD